MTRRGLAEPKGAFRGAARVREHSGHLSGIAPRSKRAVNLSVDAELLTVAKEMNINLSRVLESALRHVTAEKRARRFYEKNKAFIDCHNELVEKYGTSSEMYARDFGGE